MFTFIMVLAVAGDPLVSAAGPFPTQKACEAYQEVKAEALAKAGLQKATVDKLHGGCFPLKPVKGAL